jgi:hypothetical protein
VRIQLLLVVVFAALLTATPARLRLGRASPSPFIRPSADYAAVVAEARRLVCDRVLPYVPGSRLPLR